MSKDARTSWAYKYYKTRFGGDLELAKAHYPGPRSTWTADCEKTCNTCGETGKVADLFYGTNHATCKSCTLARQRAAKYGISKLELELLDTGVCEICETTEGKMCVDHCHETGEVRGLLCEACNFMLGHAKDNPTTLANAIDYLKKGA